MEAQPLIIRKSVKAIVSNVQDPILSKSYDPGLQRRANFEEIRAYGDTYGPTSSASTFQTLPGDSDSDDQTVTD